MVAAAEMEENMESRYLLQAEVIAHGVNGTWGVREEETSVASGFSPGKLV